MKKRIYLDYASITPIDPRALRIIENIQRKFFYNPSALYQEGRNTRKVIDEARKKVANVLQCKSDEIFFTGGGTESNNIAIQGVFNKFISELKIAKNIHLITSTIEHSSVLEVFRNLKNKGAEVTYISPNKEGIIGVDSVLKVLRKETRFISLMYGNNEIGTINPISKIFKEIKKEREKNNLPPVITHTDASQGACYLNMRADYLGADLITLDGSKLYGPRGTGTLFKKMGVNISPILLGGGHEEGIRSGTENAASIAGFAEAIYLVEKEKEAEKERLTKLRDEGIKYLKENIHNLIVNGSETQRLPNNINVCVPGIDAEFAVIKLDLEGIACSSVTTCRNIGDDSSSYVIEELYKNEEIEGEIDCSRSSLRISLGRYTKRADLMSALKIICRVINEQLKNNLTIK